MTAEKAKTLAAQRFGPAQIDSDNRLQSRPYRKLRGRLWGEGEKNASR